MTSHQNDATIIDFQEEGLIVVEPALSDDDPATQPIEKTTEDGEMSAAKNSCILSIMMVLVGLFMLAEVATGVWSNSIALLSDAFHMLSDFLALLVGYIALQLSQRRSSDSRSSMGDGFKSYGWQRAEIIGALVNGKME